MVQVLYNELGFIVIYRAASMDLSETNAGQMVLPSCWNAPINIMFGSVSRIFLAF